VVGGGRWSAKRTVSVILKLLRGANLESTSRKYRVTAATLTTWSDRFLAGGEGGLKTREADVDDEERRRLKSVVPTVSVENELLREKIARLESGRPSVLGVETMSRTVSPSSNRSYGGARVVAVWDLARSSFYAARHRHQQPRGRLRNAARRGMPTRNW
jgi:hypothetical protein